MSRHGFWQHLRDLTSPTAIRRSLEAVEWLDRIESGRMSESERAQLHAWLEVPENARALTQFTSMRAMFDELSDERKALLNKLAPDTSHATAGPRIVLPPGYRLAAVLRFLLTRTAYDKYIYPVISDMQAQYMEALAAGRRWEARWIVVRQHLSIFVSWNWLYAFVVRELIRFLWRLRR
jgi:ferric-dicitrate binding protein FerR (iron transport regulator)